VKNKRSPLVRLLTHAKSFRKRIALASLCSVLNKVFDLAPPLLIGAAIDVVVTREKSFLSGLGYTDPAEQLWILAGLTVLIWALESTFQYLYAILWRNLAQSLQHKIRLDAYGHVQTLEMKYFEERSTGGLMSILNDDVNQLERFLDGGANEVWQVVTTVIVIPTIFFTLAPSIAWLAMLPIPIILWGSFHFQKKLAPRYAAVREQVGMLNGQLSNNLSGIATIKSFTAEAHEVERIGRESDAYRSANRDAILVSSAFVPLIRMAIVVGFVATLVYGGHLALAGDLRAGAYGVMVFLTQRLLWPLTRLGDTFDLYQRAMASTARILDLIDTEPGIRGGKAAAPTPANGEIRFEGVGFRYHPTLPILDGLDLTLEAGRFTGIVGATGSGKTTLIKLLLRYYDVQEGRVTLDGTDVRELELESLRDSIGLVSQDVFLFHGSVFENIEYGRRGATREEVIAAAKVAEAHEFIEALPDGYDTVVGERGQKLSGGQRQRLSIARAVLKDPPVLVLDEATSSVDNETEAAIQRSLERIAVGRTTAIIAHRLSTVRNADKIHVLEAGRVLESGTHEALIAANGAYASLWRVQTGQAAGPPHTPDH